MSSKRRVRVNMCTKKVRFSKEEVARMGAQNTKSFDHAPLHSYECPFCGGFHIGHVSEKYGSKR